MADQSLADKLKALGVNLGARDLPSPAKPREYAFPIEAVVSGEFRPTALGSTFVVEEVFDAGHRQGQVGLELANSLDMLGQWAGDPHLHHLSPDQFAFLDTETTGLAGGTGTYAFLVGVGRFEGDRFRLAQFFMRGPAEEPALLAGLSDFLDGCQALVTFNGRGFDVPLLNTRYTLNAIPSPLKAMVQVDLLLLARRLWRRRLPSRALGYLETAILGAERTSDDVPGWYIPELYFRYLQTGDARPLKGIFYHNAMDILSLAALLNHMAGLLESPLERIDECLDMISVANLFEDLGHGEAACRLYERGLELDLPAGEYEQTLRRLAVLHRRSGRIEAAVNLWHRAAEDRHLYAPVELAKYYEHHVKDVRQAEYWTLFAIDLVGQSRLSRFDRRQWLEELEHRLARVRRKLSATGQG